MVKQLETKSEGGRYERFADRMNRLVAIRDSFNELSIEDREAFMESLPLLRRLVQLWKR